MQSQLQTTENLYKTQNKRKESTKANTDVVQKISSGTWRTKSTCHHKHVKKQSIQQNTSGIYRIMLMNSAVYTSVKKRTDAVQETSHYM